MMVGNERLPEADMALPALIQELEVIQHALSREAKAKKYEGRDAMEKIERLLARLVAAKQKSLIVTPKAHVPFVPAATPVAKPAVATSGFVAPARAAVPAPAKPVFQPVKK